MNAAAALSISRAAKAQRGGAPQASAGQGPSAAPTKTARVTSGVMLWTLKGPFDEKLAIAARAGIQSVELVSEHLAWSDAEAAKYKSLAQSYGLGMDALLCQHEWTKRQVTMVNPAHREAFLQDLRDSIVWAKKLNVPQIILMSGNVQPDMSHEAQYASMVESGKRAAEIADDGRRETDSGTAEQQSGPQRLFFDQCEGRLAGGEGSRHPALPTAF